MAVRRLVLGVMLGLAAAWAGTARAEDPVVHTQPLKTEVFEDIVDGIGGVLGVLVGPPISSPSPYLNTPGALPEEPPAPPAPKTVTAPPVVQPPAVPVEPAVVSVPVVVAPVPPPPPPTPKAVAAPPAPPPRPAAPVAAAPAVPPAPVAVAAPSCTVRVAATATLEQMRRLPKCP